jgi:DNA-binding GntR family transcriptional regulator
MLGTSRESINRALSALSSKGLIDRLGRSVVVVDLDGLRRDIG